MFKALKTFTCKNFAMYKGQEKEIEDINIINDLLNVGYIEEIKKPIEESVEEPIEESVEEPIEESVEKPKTSRKKK